MTAKPVRSDGSYTDKPNIVHRKHLERRHWAQTSLKGFFSLDRILEMDRFLVDFKVISIVARANHSDCFQFA